MHEQFHLQKLPSKVLLFQAVLKYECIRNFVFAGFNLSIVFNKLDRNSTFIFH